MTQAPGIGIVIALASRHATQAARSPDRLTSPYINPLDKEHFMIPGNHIRRRWIATVGLALVSSFAFADDSSMSVLTGDSYAYFNNLDYNPGRFNTARVNPPPDRGTAMRKPRETPGAEKNRDAQKAPGAGKLRDAIDKPIMLADRPRTWLPSPFTDDKGA